MGRHDASVRVSDLHQALDCRRGPELHHVSGSAFETDRDLLRPRGYHQGPHRHIYQDQLYEEERPGVRNAMENISGTSAMDKDVVMVDTTAEGTTTFSGSRR